MSMPFIRSVEKSASVFVKKKMLIFIAGESLNFFLLGVLKKIIFPFSGLGGKFPCG
jgi:hypothetical protein